MLYRFKKAFLLATLTSVIVMALVFIVVSAGTLTPPGAPGFTMHSLQEIYDVLADNNTVVSVADINGNVLEQLKYISGMTLQQIYNNSGVAPTIAGSSANAILTLQQTGAGNIFDLRDGSNSLFSVSSTGLISGASGQIKAAAGSTFYNNGGYAIAATGEEILRASIPIFGYDFPARTAITKTISREIKLDAGSFPALPAGADRIYKFKIQYANDVINVNKSSWQIYDVTDGVNFGLPFEIDNTGIANLNDSKVYYAAKDTGNNNIALPVTGHIWHLIVTAPASTIIQIYQLELLAYDVLQ